MSNQKPATSTTVIVVVVAVMFCFVVAAVVGLTIFAREGTDVGPTVTALLGALATAIPILVTLVKVQEQGAKQNELSEKVDYLANGGTDAKNRAALADVLKPELLKDDPETQAQLEADRAHREAGPGGNGHAAGDGTAP
jgi:hypothetical protein